MSGEQVAPNLYKRGDFYHVRVMINGESKWRSTGKTTLKAAIKAADEIKVRLRNGEAAREAMPTFREWAKTYKSVYTVNKTNTRNDDNAIEHGLATFGPVPLDRITKTLCQVHLNRRLKEAAASTVDLEHAILQAVIQKAVDDGLIEKNPWKGIDKQKPGPRIRTLSEASELKLRAVLTADQNRWLTWMLETGLRIEECRGVGLTEVDLDAHLAHVPAESAKYGKTRSVPLSDEAELAVAEQVLQVGKLWHSAQSHYRNLLTVGCSRAGIGHISPHDLRHTFATRYIKGGGDIFILSKILGHSSVTVTEKMYVHLLPEDLVAPRRAIRTTANPNSAYFADATKSATIDDQPTSSTFNRPNVTLSENIQEV